MAHARSLVILVLLVTLASSLALPPSGGSTLPTSLPKADLRASPQVFSPTHDRPAAVGGPSVPSGASTVITVGPDPAASAWDPKNNEIYFVDLASNNVTAVDGSTNQVVATIGLGRSRLTMTQGSANQTFALFDPANGMLYVDGTMSGNVSVVNTSTNTLEAVIGPVNGACSPPPGSCYSGGAMALDPSTDTLYVSCSQAWCIDEVNTTTDTITSVAAAGPGNGPTGLVYDPTNDLLYSTYSGNEVLAQNAQNLGRIVATIDVAPSATYIALDPDNGNLYVAEGWGPSSQNVPNATVSVINTTTNKLQALVHPGGYQEGGLTTSIAFASGYVLVTNENFSLMWPTPCCNLTVFNEWTGSILTSYPLSQIDPPSSLVVDPLNGEAYVSGGSPSCTPQPTCGDSVEVVSLPGLAKLSFTASDLTPSLGQRIYLNSTLVLDVPPYNWSYTGLPPGCLSQNTSSLPCVPSTPGNYTVRVSMTDRHGNTLTQSLTLAVQRGPTLSLAPPRRSVDVNESLTFRSTVFGGQGPFLFSYHVSSAAVNCSSSTGPWLNCTPSSSLVGGTFNVTAEVTDTFGISATATSGPVQVYSALRASLVASSQTPLLAQTVAFSANATGGHAPYTYSYGGLPYGCYSENRSAIGCLPTQSDWYNVTVFVTDRSNATVNATVEMHVIFDFNVVIPASTPVGKQLTIAINTNESFNSSAFNKSATLLAQPEGGYGAFTYSYAGLPPGCTSADVATLTCVPTQAGVYQVTITVLDQAGDHQSHTVPVHVVAASNGPVPQGLLGLPGYDGYIAIGGVVAAVLLAAVVLAKRKRGRAPSKSVEKTGPKDPTQDTSGAAPSADHAEGPSKEPSTPSDTIAEPATRER